MAPGCGAMVTEDSRESKAEEQKLERRLAMELEE